MGFRPEAQPMLFPPTRTEALARLEAFVPNAGRRYADARNRDQGPGLRDNVSMLSPYIRHRVLTEHEVPASVMRQHSPQAAAKFIQEVFWRTYWKGWLQMRPQGLASRAQPIRNETPGAASPMRRSPKVRLRSNVWTN